MTNVPMHYDAIVLGAGISGLGAGKVLKKANLNFVILEGQDRVGGRINTVEMDEVRVDAGAQWLHGRNNELFKFAEKFNLIRPELSEEAEGDYVSEDGEKLDEFFVKKVDFKIGQILEECEEFVKHKNEEKFKFPKSIEQFVNSNFKTFVDDLESAKEKQQALQLLDWHRKFQIIDNSCLHFDDVSAKDWGNYSFNGESCQAHLNVHGGLNRIVDKLEEALKADIKLNENVQLIYWKSEQYKERPNLITIVCKNGSIYTTNNLICTFSVGVLKNRHLEMFSPPLPVEHREVIENIGFGTINKIFLHFEEKWWSDDWKGLQLIWNDEINDVSKMTF
jgi:spermine oxidase